MAIRRKKVRKIRKAKRVTNEEDNEEEGMRIKIDKITVAGGASQYKPLILEMSPVDEITVTVPGSPDLNLSSLKKALKGLHGAVSSAVPASGDEGSGDEEVDEEEVEEDEEEEEEAPKKKSVKKKKDEEEEDEEDDSDEEEDEEEDEDEDDDEEEDEVTSKKKKAVAKKSKKKSEGDDDLDALMKELDEEE